MDPNLFLFHMSKTGPETTGSLTKVPKLVRKRSGTERHHNITFYVTFVQARISSSTTLLKGNSQKVKTLHIFQIIRFLDIKTSKSIKKIILQTQ